MLASEWANIEREERIARHDRLAMQVDRFGEPIPSGRFGELHDYRKGTVTAIDDVLREEAAFPMYDTNLIDLLHDWRERQRAKSAE